VKVLVDTSIWSIALRRSVVHNQALIAELELLIKEVRVQLIGPIRQEILSGIKSEKQFLQLKSYLKAFPDYAIQTVDYELAADYYNICRRKGVQGSNTDFLICAISTNHNWPIFTLDQDFYHFQKLIAIKIYKARD
jgi:predicted nucleic acid-binding protein